MFKSCNSTLRFKEQKVAAEEAAYSFLRLFPKIRTVEDLPDRRVENEDRQPARRIRIWYALCHGILSILLMGNPTGFFGKWSILPSPFSCQRDWACFSTGLAGQYPALHFASSPSPSIPLLSVSSGTSCWSSFSYSPSSAAPLLELQNSLAS